MSVDADNACSRGSILSANALTPLFQSVDDFHVYNGKQFLFLMNTTDIYSFETVIILVVQ